MKNDLTVCFLALLMGVVLLSPAAYAEGDAISGVQVYKDNCAACHGANMEGSVGPAFADNEFVTGSEDAEIVSVVTNGRAANGMPAFTEQLSEQQILDVVALLKNPDVLAAQSAVTLDIKRPEVETGDILGELIKSFAFVFLWTGVAIVALLAWINYKE
ncbi:Cbb3-type cytochrome c oxidase subunit CcoP1 [archaeon BMS3Abin16]|nr:Cbb3-type cytochrome c oxidase subunit CcoP1 [archaeon BMS3Abin16]